MATTPTQQQQPTFSAAGLALLKHSEGFSPTVYIDRGAKAIGYGHHLAPYESFPNPITEQQASNILTSDVRTVEFQLSRMVRVPLTQGQHDALVDFVYNLGAGRLFGSTLLRLLNARNYDGAGQQLLLWDHAGDEEVAGLKARRQAEHALWSS